MQGGNGSGGDMENSAYHGFGMLVILFAILL